MGGRPGTAYDGRWWSAVHALYDEAFPGLPDGIRAASDTGVDWAEVTTPFALFEGDRCVSHVGVITHPMWLGGEVVRIAGIHAVCTAADRRRRGLCRRTLAAALEWADRTHALAKLHTDDPGVYEGQGFTTRPTWRFRASDIAPIEAAQRVLRPRQDDGDRRLLARLLARRTPLAKRCASADPGWLVHIDAALTGRLDRLVYLPEHDAIACIDGGSLVVEVIAERLPPAGVIRGLCAQPMVWSFDPGPLDPGAVPELAPASLGAFMTRGPWPAIEPFGISPLWEH